MSKFAVSGMGEVMLRYSVPTGVRLQNASQLNVHVGGTEANTMTALSQLGHKTAFATSLPNSPLGKLIIQPLLTAGVDIGAIHWSDKHRLGTYYIEFAEAPRPIQVIYDRKDSAVSLWQTDEVNWDYLLDCEIFHTSGITAAISPAGLILTKEAIERAQARGCRTSFDINYRSKLWTEAEAHDVLKPMLRNIDHLFCGIADARSVLRCEGEPAEILGQLMEMSQAQTIVLTLGSDGIIGTEGGEPIFVPTRPVQRIDRLGAGDAMSAGVFHGILQGDFARGLAYGNVMAALALTQHGDMVTTSAAELEALVDSEDSSIAR